MNYEKVNHIMEELKVLQKLHCKMMGQLCTEMTPDQAKLLRLIKNDDLSQKDIAKKLYITEATLSVRMKRLVDSGWVAKNAHSKDKRKYQIVLTSKGEEMIHVIDHMIEKYQEAVCQGITDEEYQTILNVILKMQNNLREEIQ